MIMQSQTALGKVIKVFALTSKLAKKFEDVLFKAMQNYWRHLQSVYNRIFMLTLLFMYVLLLWKPHQIGLEH